MHASQSYQALKDRAAAVLTCCLHHAIHLNRMSWSSEPDFQCHHVQLLNITQLFVAGRLHRDTELSHRVAHISAAARPKQLATCPAFASARSKRRMTKAACDLLNCRQGRALVSRSRRSARCYVHQSTVQLHDCICTHVSDPA